MAIFSGTTLKKEDCSFFRRLKRGEMDFRELTSKGSLKLLKFLWEKNQRDTRLDCDNAYADT